MFLNLYLNPEMSKLVTCIIAIFTVIWFLQWRIAIRTHKKSRKILQELYESNKIALQIMVIHTLWITISTIVNNPAAY